MVDLKDGVVHAHTLDTVLELVEEHLARIVERFVVNTDGKYEMAEEKVRNLVSPCALSDEKLLAHGLDAFSKRCLHLSTILVFLNEMCGCPCAC